MFAYPLGDGAELRSLEPWQAAEFADAVEHSREHLRPWVPLGTRVVDVDSATTTLQQYADMQAADTGRLCGIWADGVLSGCILFKDFNTHIGSCEMGVWLALEAQGRGLINKAAQYMLAWAFDIRGMGRVEWRCDPANKRSVAAAERLGFVYEGLLRNEWMINGQRKDTSVYSIIDKDWNAISGKWSPQIEE